MRFQAVRARPAVDSRRCREPGSATGQMEYVRHPSYRAAWLQRELGDKSGCHPAGATHAILAKSAEFVLFRPRQG
jgi:hypothetical protein